MSPFLFLFLLLRTFIILITSLLFGNLWTRNLTSVHFQTALLPISLFLRCLSPRPLVNFYKPRFTLHYEKCHHQFKVFKPLQAQGGSPSSTTSHQPRGSWYNLQVQEPSRLFLQLLKSPCSSHLKRFSHFSLWTPDHHEHLIFPCLYFPPSVWFCRKLQGLFCL